MSAKFELRPSLRPRDVAEKKVVEYVEIHTGRDGRDVVHRQAVPEDFEAYREEWAAFKKLHPARYPESVKAPAPSTPAPAPKK